MQGRLNRRVSRSTETLAARLKLARAKRGLSQDQLAVAARLKQPDISKLERGDMLKTTGMARLAAALQVPAAWLELGEGEEPSWNGEPRKPGPKFQDRHEVSESDWATLQAVKIMLSEKELDEIRERAKRVEARASERIAATATAARLGNATNLPAVTTHAQRGAAKRAKGGE